MVPGGALVMAKLESVTITDLSGGRNDYDSPLDIPDDQCRIVSNMDFWQSPMGTKRWGAVAIGITFSGGGPFGGAIGSLHRFVPGSDETAAELWAIDRSSVSRFARLFGGTTWVQATLVDNLAAVTDADNVVSATLNGALYLCYKNTSANNRIYVWDSALSMVRRVGLATPANAPTAADGAGGALSFTRYYRTRHTLVSGADTRIRSEASAVVSHTIAAKAGVTVTKDASYPANEQDTHWELEASDAAAGPWYRIASTAVGTGTFSDTNATIPTTNPTALDGINRPPPAAQFIIATDSRLIMAGLQSNVTATTPVRGRTSAIYVTPVIGDNDVGDSERVPLGLVYTVDAPITGLAGPLDGAFYVFSFRKIWKFVPTNNPADPYARYSINSAGVGCIRHQTIVMAEDENGNPCIYFLSARGPYRIGAAGLQFLGRDIVNEWALVVLNAKAHAVYHGDKYQVWFYASQNAADTTNIKFKFDTRKGRPGPSADQIRKGWTTDSGDSAITYASVMFAKTIGASMSLDLKPYVAPNSTAIWKADAEQVVLDGTEDYAGLIVTKEYAPQGLLHNISVQEPTVFYASPRADQSELFRMRLEGNFAEDGGTAATALVVNKSVAWDTGTEADAIYYSKVEGLELAGLGTFAYRMGDVTGASEEMFSFVALAIPVEVQERR